MSQLYFGFLFLTREAADFLGWLFQDMFTIFGYQIFGSYALFSPFLWTTCFRFFWSIILFL